MIHNDVLALIVQNAPPAEGDGPTPAAACECVVRTTTGYQIQGVLAVHLNGFKIAMPSLVRDPKFPNNESLAKRVIAEHFLDADAIECLVFLRPVDPALVQGVDRKPLIHMG